VVTIQNVKAHENNAKIPRKCGTLVRKGIHSAIADENRCVSGNYWSTIDDCVRRLMAKPLRGL
jgi:hypothetical protein